MLNAPHTSNIRTLITWDVVIISHDNQHQYLKSDKLKLLISWVSQSTNYKVL